MDAYRQDRCPRPGVDPRECPCARATFSGETTARTGRRTSRELREMTVQDETTATGVVLSDTAASKVKALLDQEGRDDLALRVAVQPGGCSGLRYQLFFDERSLDGDVRHDFGGVGVVVDRMSIPYLAGATIDFVDTIEKQGFTIDNPNAGGSCACGDSFH
jgi:iron-sulfur cluster assembly accessory protein